MASMRVTVKRTDLIKKIEAFINKNKPDEKKVTFEFHKALRSYVSKTRKVLDQIEAALDEGKDPNVNFPHYPSRSDGNYKNYRQRHAVQSAERDLRVLKAATDETIKISADGDYAYYL